MPTYEYVCQACNNRFEIWQKMSDEPLTVCAECGGHIRRVIFPAGVVFKGSGFYKTDHAGSSALSTNGHNHTDKAEGESKTTAEKPAGENGSKETSSSDTKSNAKTSENKAPAATASKQNPG